MAKQEVGRAAKSDVSQKDAAELLKKKVQEQEAEAVAADVSEEVTAEAAAVETAAAAVVATPAAEAPAAMFAAAEGTGVLGTNLSTGAAVGIGLAVVGGGVLIAEATDDDDDGAPPVAGSIKVTATSNGTTPITSVPEGGQIIYVVEGSPGQVFNYTFSGVSAGDFTATPANSVVIGTDGKAFVTVTVTDDQQPEGNETLTLVGLGTPNTVSVGVTIVDGTLQENYVLTQGIDNFPTPDRGPIGIVEGIVGAVGPTGTNTYSAGDTLIGNSVGTSILELNVVVTGTAAAVEVENFAAIELNAATAGTIVFNAAEWNNVGQLELVDGVNGMTAVATSADVGLDLVINDGIAGGLIGSYTNGLVAGVINSSVGGGSLVHDANGVPDFTVDASGGPGTTNTGTMFAVSTGSNDIVVGDMTGVADDSDTLVAAIAGSQDVTFGDISLTAGDTSLLTASIAASSNATGGDITIVGGDNANVSVTALAVTNLTLGNIDITVGDSTATMSATRDVVFVGAFAATATSGTGNLAVGDISVVAGDNYFVSLTLSNTATGTDLTAGDISITVGDTTASATTALAGISASISNNTALAGGDLTVGDISLTMGENATLDFDIFLTGETGTAMTGSLGNFTLGNISVNMGEDSTGTLSAGMYQSASTTTQGMGSFTVGDISVTLGQDASFNLYFSQSMSGTSGGAMGDFTVGDVNGTLGIGASFSYNWTVSNSATGDIGTVTVGDFIVVGDDAASVTYSGYVFATSGDIGSVSIGDIDITVGVGGAISDIEFSITANNIGTVDFGDLTLTLGQSATVDTVTFSVTATGDIGSFSFGDVNINFDESATFTSLGWFLSAGGDIGSVTFGDHNLVFADGASLTGNSVSITANDIGTVTFGDISIELNEAAVLTGFVRDISASSDVGDVTFGDFVLNAVNNTNGTDFNFTVSASGDIDSVSFGDVSLIVSGVTATAAATAAYSFTALISATAELGEVNVGNVLLSYTSNYVGSLGFYLTASAAATENTLSIAGIALDVTEVGTTAAAAADDYTLSVLAGGAAIDIGVVDIDATLSSTFAGTAALLAAEANLFNLTSIFASISTTATTTALGRDDITVGTIDYSDYVYAGQAAAATIANFVNSSAVEIDASFLIGDIVIIGSDGVDAIYDNVSANTLTGGDGADFFLISGGNTGVTLANVDVITDFVHNEDILIIGTTSASFATAITAPTVNEYAEDTYTSFAEFLADANALASATASPDYLIAGQIGADVFVAVDGNQDGTIDFVIQLQGVSINTLDFGDFAFNL